MMHPALGDWSFWAGLLLGTLLGVVMILLVGLVPDGKGRGRR